MLPLIEKAYENVLNFIFPPLCIVCTESRLSDNFWFCEECSTKLKKNNSDRDACSLCSQNKKIKSCTCSLVWDQPYQKIHSLFDFDDIIQKIAHHVKYKGRKKLAYDIAKEFTNKVPDSFFRDVNGIIPIPLHFIRKMKRGYNQAEFLARGFADCLTTKIPLYTGILVRTRHTKTQTKLDKEQRQANLKGAFKVLPQKSQLIKNKNLVLVDDVVTTGATTGYCAEILLKAGAQTVKVLSLARD